MAGQQDLKAVIARGEDACAREPIHLAGAIQPHGYLLALDAAGLAAGSLAVVTRSANLDAPAALAGWLPDAIIDACRAVTEDTSLEAEIPGFGPVAVHCFRAGGCVFCEFEPAAPPATPDPAADRTLAKAIAGMAGATGIGDLSGHAARAIRALSAFDRVVVYRFDPDGNGEVVGESLAADWDQSLLGLCFPASDIPPQARALYRRVGERWMPTRDYVPVPLVPATDTHGHPFDLSLSRYRSVSPVHRLYQGNIGADGSMSISVLRGGVLWGMVIGHHRRPHLVPMAARHRTVAVAQAFSLALDALLSRQAEAEVEQDSHAFSAMLAKLAGADDFLSALTEGKPDALGLLTGCSGAAVVWEDDAADSHGRPHGQPHGQPHGRPHAVPQVRLLGRPPPAAVLAPLAAFCRAAAEEGVFASDHLPGCFPAIADHAAVASGVLACCFSDSRRATLLLFRPEVVRSVAWAGRPEKITGEDGQPNLPRRSFDRWTEIRHGHAAPWQPWELDFARTLRATVDDVIIRQTRRIEELSRVNAELESFSYAVSHDLRQPLRMVSGYLGLIARRLGGGLTSEVQEFLDFAITGAQQMDRMILDVLAYARIGHHAAPPAPVPLAEVLAECLAVLEDARAEAGAEIAVAADLPTVNGHRGDLARVFQNLVGNAIKYRDADRPLRIGIDVRDAGADWEIRVSDTGAGIAAEDISRVFAVFHRVTASRDREGAGIGLSICKKIIEQHGGRIWITSQPGQGSCFHVTLPKQEGSPP